MAAGILENLARILRQIIVEMKDPLAEHGFKSIGNQRRSSRADDQGAGKIDLARRCRADPVETPVMVIGDVADRPPVAHLMPEESGDPLDVAGKFLAQWKLQTEIEVRQQALVRVQIIR